MHFSDHNPPHFHASYAGHEALIEIDSLAVCRGWLPRRALMLVMEWAIFHRDELRYDWELACNNAAPLNPIDPLD
ncbi:MAG: hypothetical protein BWY09_00111 [Candidatus Hydrogenedentes bacterium ADurb.Bin179]|nr:MAG: hypothetical protein BWY09_00111 [Candidatus Hydrogenedentes bacterium ADurb.Bin179]